MRALVFTFTLLTLVLATGCLGSPHPYRPYKGEGRPPEVPPPDPNEKKLRLETMSYQDVQNDLYFTQSRKEIQSVASSRPRNPWRAYEQDMTSERLKPLLAEYSKIKVAKYIDPNEASKPAGTGEPLVVKKKDEGEKKEGEGEKKEEEKKE